MTKKIVWRLPSRPTPEEVRGLVKDGLITKDEAREILFNLEDNEERDVKSLEDEIKFLRELVTKLSDNSRTTIIEKLREVQVPYKDNRWYKPYEVWCKDTASNAYTNGGSISYMTTTNSTSGGVTVGYLAAEPTSFKDIKTF